MKKQMLVKSVKEQAQMFLLDAGEFYPFGTCIDKEGRLRPIGVYLDNDNPSSSEVLALLEKGIKNGILNGEYKFGVLTLDVRVKENNVDYDALELRFFELNQPEHKRYIKYHTFGNHIEFID